MNKERNKTSIKIFMILLFILTIVSIFAALLTWGFVNEYYCDKGIFSFSSNTWIFWLWLPIPISSIVLGYKYKKLGLKCKKNIVAGYIIGILLLIYGSFWLIMPSYNDDYSEIDKYKSIINITLPKNGKLEKIKWDYVSEADKTNYQSIYVYYNKENELKLEKEIKNNEFWISSNNIKSELKLLLYTSTATKQFSYFLFYNYTLDEYNTLPKEPGNYEFCVMMYSSSLNLLQIDTFKYTYK